VSADVQQAGSASEGMFVSVAGLPNEQLKGAGKAFVAGFKKATGGTPDPYSVYAAQAAEIMVQAIAKSDGSRASVSKNLFKTKIKNGILGTFSINKNGDTSSNPVTVYRVKGGQQTTFKVIVPPVSLVKTA
jgi:ABC-type branched-subunit amino acid transport system substrate-binding protein